MKHGIGKALWGGVLAVMLLPTTASAAFLTDWFLDPDGPGMAYSPTPVAEFLDFSGAVLVENTDTGGGTISFEEFGVFNTTGLDGGPAFQTVFPGIEITGVLEATGTGFLGDPGEVTFDAGGTLDLWSDSPPNFGTTDSFHGADDGTNFANLTLVSGTGQIGPSVGAPNGLFTLLFSVDVLSAGYFFDENMNDLNSLAGLFPPILFGFTTTNASLLTNPSTDLQNELTEGFTNVFQAPDPINNTDLFISNNGQFRLSIPEPGAVLLFGTALLGMAWVVRRRSVEPKSR